MSMLRVRMYNVYQGDAFLVEVPDRDASGGEVLRHILIDVGNLWHGEPGSSNQVYKRIFKDVQKRLKGRPVDLYVMTHQHYDHVEGPLFAKKSLNTRIRADYVWMPLAAKKKDLGLGAYYPAYLAQLRETQRYLAASNRDLHESRLMAFNNDPGKTTACVDFIKTIASKSRTHFVYRGIASTDLHPFRDCRLSILAPEKELSLYFTSLPFVPLGVSRSRRENAKPEVNVPIPPAGVDAGAFYNLVAHRRDGFVDGLLSSGAYVNNTSVVFRLEWKGWTLLFTGDAQTASWRHMNRTGGLRPIHFLKAGHHGSHNATPDGKWFNRLLPEQSSDGKPRVAAVSAYKKAYGHPHKQVKDRLDKRCDTVVLTEQSPSIKYVDFDFDEQDVSIRSVRQF